MDKLFGTDGIRGVDGQFPLDFSSIYTLGFALSGLLLGEGLEPRLLIGRDTRESGPRIERALVRGIRDCGGDAASAGVIPTSAISILTRKYKLSAGIVISASHNPYHDNGIKIFSSQGIKIPEEWEARLEKEIRAGGRKVVKKSVQIATDTTYTEDYIAFLKSSVDLSRSGKKWKVALDCANGASSAIAPRIHRELGIEVVVIHCHPDGKNINLGCGSLHPQGLARKVLDAGCDLGIAYDGDADRAIWVDERGRILNGDHTLFVQAVSMSGRGRLKGGKVVATILSNMGLEVALQKRDLKLLRTQVGDKYVLDRMLGEGANLGGEQSGHTIFLDNCPTGDGILTGLKMLAVMHETGLPLSKLAEELEEFPQTHLNIRVGRKIDFDEFPEIVQVRTEIESLLDGQGRLELRYSGTEPLARIMVEGRDKAEIKSYARKMGAVIENYLGQKT